MIGHKGIGNVKLEAYPLAAVALVLISITLALKFVVGGPHYHGTQG